MILGVVGGGGREEEGEKGKRREEIGIWRMALHNREMGNSFHCGDFLSLKTYSFVSITFPILKHKPMK